MSDTLRASVVHRKPASEAVLDIHDDQSHGDKVQRQASAFSRKASFLCMGLIFLLIVMGANYANVKVQGDRPLRKEPSVRSDSIQTESRGRLDERIDGGHSHSTQSAMSRESSVSAGQDSKMLVKAPTMQQPSDSINMIPEPAHVDSKQLPTASASNVHSHLLAFIDHLNSAGRNPRSDCDDPDFKDADLVYNFHNKKADICTSASALHQSGVPKIGSSHIICYQHQQARHSATDSLCEGRNVALHLPSFEGSAMTGFVEATWMSMKQGALQAACTPMGSFSKDKFPLCLSDWFVSGFRQVMVLPIGVKHSLLSCLSSTILLQPFFFVCNIFCNQVSDAACDEWIEDSVYLITRNNNLNPYHCRQAHNSQPVICKHKRSSCRHRCWHTSPFARAARQCAV